MSSAKWKIAERRSDDLFEHLCLLRGFDPNTLRPDFTSQLHDPFLLPDMKLAVELVEKAKNNNWSTVIFGDYDADGTPASALLSIVFKRLGIIHEVILPNRTEGYGLRRETINELPADTKLLITVDTGIAAVEEIKLAKNKGVAVIVLDHHLPKDELPLADAVVDPFVPENKYPFTGLCGCALAWKLACALATKFPDELTEGVLKWLLDLVAVSTVADMMPLTGENRVLVHFGLEVLRHNRRPGLRAMLELAAVNVDKMTAGTLGFTIGPRLNASGRLHDNRPAYELLIADDYGAAYKLAGEIEKANWKRQQLVEKIMAQADTLLFRQNSKEDRCFVLVGEDWPPGVLGLVAGKLTGKYYRPAIVLNKGEATVSGSARSTGEYSIIDGLTSQEKLLSRFGGHKQAAGVNLKPDDLSEFVDGIKAHAASVLSPEDLVPTYQADAILKPDEISLKTAESLEKLQPFGLQNSQPLFVVEGVKLGKPKPMGKNGDHLKWFGKKDDAELEIVGFGISKRFSENPLESADLLGNLETNHWNGMSRLQLRLVDWRHMIIGKKLPVGY